MRPTREGKVSPSRPGLVYRGIGIDPDVVTEDPEPPTDRAALGQAYVPFLVTGAAEVVQFKSGSVPAVANITVTLDATPTIGNTLVACVYAIYDGGPTYSLNNGTWTQVGSDVYSGSGTNLPNRMFRTTVLSSTSAATTVTVSGGTSSGRIKVVIVELSGVDTVDADTGQKSNTSATTDTVTPTASLPAVIISATGTRNGSSPELSPAGSMTELVEIVAGVDRPLAVNYQEIASTTGSYTVGSTGASANSSMIAAVFEDTGESIVWIEAPLSIDGDEDTFEYAYDTGITEFWRMDLGDTYLIGSMTARLAYETAGSNPVLLQAGNESDYSDAVTIATIPLTATGSFTEDDIADSWTPTAVYRYWQLVQTTEDDVRIHDVELFDAEDASGVSDHPSLTGRDDADQHPADAVSYDPTASGLTATDVQAAIDEVVATGAAGVTVQDEGTPLATAASSLDFVGAGVTASGTGATKTITISGGAGSSELDYVQITSNVTPTATTEATANTVVTGSAVSYDGSTTVMIEFWASNARPDTGAAGRVLQFALYDGSSSIGILSTQNSVVNAQSQNVPVHLMRRLTPSNASHTYSIRAWVNAGTGLIGAGAGGSATTMPAFIRISTV